MISSYSHVPVLVALGCERQPAIRRVLELGAGVFSREAIMSLAVFPFLERYDILENGEEWYYHNVRHEMEVSQTTRSCATLHYAQIPMVEFVQRFDLEAYDLIFIDDSVTVDARVATIEYVTSVARSPILAIHDFEDGAYRYAVRGSRRVSVFDHAEPHTAVLWPKARMLDVDRFREPIRCHFAEQHLSSPEIWLSLLS